MTDINAANFGWKINQLQCNTYFHTKLAKYEFRLNAHSLQNMNFEEMFYLTAGGVYFISLHYSILKRPSLFIVFFEGEETTKMS